MPRRIADPAVEKITIPRERERPFGPRLRALTFADHVNLPRIGATSLSSDPHTPVALSPGTAHVPLATLPKPAISAFRRRGVYPWGAIVPFDGLTEFENPSPAHAAANADALVGLALSLVGTTPEGSSARWALSEVSKAVSEIGQYFPGWYHAPLRVPSVDVRPLRGALQLVARVLAPGQRPLANVWPVKLGTNTGSPFWSSEARHRVASFAMAAEVLSAQPADRATALTRLGRSSREITGFEFPDAPLMSLFTRTGPMRKPTPVCFLTRAGLFREGETKGRWCRIRHVRPVAAYANETMRDAALGTAVWMKTSPVGRSIFAPMTPAETLALLSGPGVLVSDDASNFDDSQSAELIDAALSLTPTVAWERDVTRITLSGPLLTGPYSSNAVATIAERVGGQPSGIIWTTVLNSLVNLLTCVFCIVESGAASSYSELEADLVDRTVALRIQGDDTLMRLRRRPDPRRWAEAASLFGLTRTLDPYPVFLKVYYDTARARAYNSAARSAMRTFFREYEPPSPHSALAAAYVRFALARADPDFQPWFALVAERSAAFLHFGVSTWASLQRLVTSVAFQDALVKDARLDPFWADLATRFDADEVPDAVSALLLARIGTLMTLSDSGRLRADAIGVDWRSELRNRFFPRPKTKVEPAPLRAGRWVRDVKDHLQ